MLIVRTRRKSYENSLFRFADGRYFNITPDLSDLKKTIFSSKLRFLVIIGIGYFLR